MSLPRNDNFVPMLKATWQLHAYTTIPGQDPVTEEGSIAQKVTHDLEGEHISSQF